MYVNRNKTCSPKSANLWDFRREHRNNRGRRIRLMTGSSRIETTKMFTGTNGQVRFLHNNTTYHTTVCVNTAQYRTVQHSTINIRPNSKYVQHRAAQYSKVQYNTVPCNIVQYSTFLKVLLQR